MDSVAPLNLFGGSVVNICSTAECFSLTVRNVFYRCNIVLLAVVLFQFLSREHPSSQWVRRHHPGRGYPSITGHFHTPRGSLESLIKLMSVFEKNLADRKSMLAHKQESTLDPCGAVLHPRALSKREGRIHMCDPADACEPCQR